MSLLPIDQNQLEATLQEVINKGKREYQPLGLTYQLLYDTGARFNEILYLPNWLFVNGGHYISYTATKTGLERTFPTSVLSLSSMNLIATDGELISHITYSRARHHMQTILSRKHLSYQNKKMHLHAFRHAFARRLHQTGTDLPTIQSYMGLKTLGITSNYVFGTIYQNS